MRPAIVCPPSLAVEVMIHVSISYPVDSCQQGSATGYQSLWLVCSSSAPHRLQVIFLSSAHQRIVDCPHGMRGMMHLSHAESSHASENSYCARTNHDAGPSLARNILQPLWLSRLPSTCIPALHHPRPNQRGRL